MYVGSELTHRHMLCCARDHRIDCRTYTHSQNTHTHTQGTKPYTHSYTYTRKKYIHTREGAEGAWGEKQNGLGWAGYAVKETHA